MKKEVDAYVYQYTVIKAQAFDEITTQLGSTDNPAEGGIRALKVVVETQQKLRDLPFTFFDMLVKKEGE